MNQPSTVAAVPCLVRFAVGAVAAVLAATSQARAGYYLELPGINGEQSTPGHPDVIALLSLSLGDGEFTVTKRTDSTSAALFLATANGTVFPTASLLSYAVEPPLGPPDTTSQFNGVLISSYQQGGDIDTLTLSYVPEPTSLMAVATAGALIGRRRR